MALQIKRRLGSATETPPPSLVVGQLGYNQSTADGASLFVGDGTSVHPLVTNQRQVELAGAQTITGAKTIALTNLHITGGTNGQTISTDGSGNLTFVSAPPASVIVDAASAISGNGLVATPITLTVATSAQVQAGTSNVNPLTPLTLREEMGAAANALNLHTTATTVVPAIAELADKLAALEGALQFVGTYNASTNQVDAGGTLAAGALPAAAPANNGFTLIISTAGTGTAPAPTVALSVGDWIVSTGTAWVHIDLDLHSVAASNVSVTTIAGLTATNAQAAFAEIVADYLKAVAVDGVTIDGDGTAGDPLEVIGYDDGTY